MRSILAALTLLAVQITPKLFLLFAAVGALLVATPSAATPPPKCKQDGVTCSTNQSCCSGVCTANVCTTPTTTTTSTTTTSTTTTTISTTTEPTRCCQCTDPRCTTPACADIPASEASSRCSLAGTLAPPGTFCGPSGNCEKVDCCEMSGLGCLQGQDNESACTSNGGTFHPRSACQPDGSCATVSSACPTPDGSGCCVITSGSVVVCVSSIGQSSNAAGAEELCNNQGGRFVRSSCDNISAAGECVYSPGVDSLGTSIVGCCEFDETAILPLRCSTEEVTSNSFGFASGIVGIVESDCTLNGGRFSALTHCAVLNRCNECNGFITISCNAEGYPCVSGTDCDFHCSSSAALQSR